MSAPVNLPGWRGWAGLVAAPSAWALHHQAGSDLNYFDCRGGGDTTVLLLIGLAALAIAVVGTWLSFAAWRAAGGGPDHRSELSARFIPALGVMAGGLFSLTILVQIGAVVVLPACFR
jgi:hypothetical protein